MQQKGQLKCTCISGFFSPQQKWFLTKKKDPKQLESPVHERRNNKSADIKCQSEIKSQKKSLKKRPNSNVSSDGHLPQPLILQEHQIQSQLKIKFEPESPNTPEYFSVPRVWDSPITNNKQIYTPISIKQATLTPNHKVNNHLQDSRNYFILPLIPTLPQQNSPIKPNHQNNLPFQRNQHEINICHQQYSNSNILNSHSISGAKNGSINLHQDNKQYPSQHIQKIHYPVKFAEKETESWIPVREDPLIIEEFDRLFKNKEQHQSHTQLNTQSKPLLRDAKKSKRLQKQLIGRFAQSDGDDDAISDPASQVIGKGFENNFQTFWQFDDLNHVQKTLGTRSTNTKGSQCHKFEIGDNLPKFGTNNHLKSYKFL